MADAFTTYSFAETQPTVYPCSWLSFSTSFTSAIHSKCRACLTRLVWLEDQDRDERFLCQVLTLFQGPRLFNNPGNPSSLLLFHQFNQHLQCISNLSSLWRVCLRISHKLNVVLQGSTYQALYVVVTAGNTPLEYQEKSHAAHQSTNTMKLPENVPRLQHQAGAQASHGNQSLANGLSSTGNTLKSPRVVSSSMVNSLK